MSVLDAMSASRARSKRCSYQLVVDRDDVSAELTELDVPAATPRHGVSSNNKDTTRAKSVEKQFIEAAVLTRSKSRAQTSKPTLPGLNGETQVDDGMMGLTPSLAVGMSIPITKVDCNSCSLIKTHLLTVERWIFCLSGCDTTTRTLKKLFARKDEESDGTAVPPPLQWAVKDAMHLVVLVAHFIYVWFEVLTFLDAYYLQKQSPTLKDTTVDVQRYVIYSSYLLIDLVYPIAMVGLIHMHCTCDLMKERELIFDKLNAPRFEADKFDTSWRRAFTIHLLYGVFHVGVLFVWLTTNSKHASIYAFFRALFHTVPAHGYVSMCMLIDRYLLCLLFCMQGTL